MDIPSVPVESSKVGVINQEKFSTWHIMCKGINLVIVFVCMYASLYATEKICSLLCDNYVDYP